MTGERGAARSFTQAQRVERGLLTEYRKTLWKPFMKAIREYELIQPGDRVAVCVSGGKDSMLLAKLTQILSRHSAIPFEAEYLLMDPGYDAAHLTEVLDNARMLEIPVVVRKSRIFEVADAQEDNPCFLCARMRRGFLYEHARELGCNKIALGHHYNDVIETTVLGMFYGGQLQGMMPRIWARNFPGMQLIRPLYMVREEDILRWRDDCGLRFIRCACRFSQRVDREQASSRRQEIKDLIRSMARTNPGVERSIFGAIHTVQVDTFPGLRRNGTTHSFLEWFEEQNPFRETGRRSDPLADRFE